MYVSVSLVRGKAMAGGGLEAKCLMLILRYLGVRKISRLLACLVVFLVGKIN